MYNLDVMYCVTKYFCNFLLVRSLEFVTRVIKTSSQLGNENKVEFILSACNVIHNMLNLNVL